MAAGYYSLGNYCEKYLGLSADAAWKRSQAVNLIEAHPDFFKLLKEGKTSVTHLSMISPKISTACKDTLISVLPGQSKRDLKDLLYRVGPDGVIAPGAKRKPVLLSLECSEEMQADLKKAQFQMSKGKNKLLSKEEVIHLALKEWIRRHDPLEKADRAKKRQEKKAASKTQANCAGANGKSSETKQRKSRYIPASVRHEIFLRDGGRCTHVGADGRRCEATHGLEIDHMKAFCHNGSNHLENLRLVCRGHNQYRADVTLGREFMDRFRHSNIGWRYSGVG
jgi:5-methylcytosine-specific restriction endonuclease McrA